MDPNKLRKLLYEKDKQQGLSGSQNMPMQKTTPIGLPTSRPPQMTKPPQAFKLGTSPATHQFHPPAMGTIHPTSHPNVIPSLPAAPKFGKLKNYFKKPKGI
jgi:hypothetical protein